MLTQNLLVELFVEELPPKALKKLGDAFAQGLLASLQSQGLATATSVAQAFASPRRLAAHITAVAQQASDKPVNHKLMPVSVGLDAQGQATPALLKRLGALGADASAVPRLSRSGEGKNEALFFETIQTGIDLTAGLQIALDHALAQLPIPKVMTYQLESDCALPGWSSVNFVRPAHGLVALHGSDVIDIRTLGLRAGRSTQGHRFEATCSPVNLSHADDYATTLLRDGAVIASFAQRRAEIERQLHEAAQRVGGGCQPIQDDALLDEVTALVERPNVLICSFDTEFLGVPQECLILTMKANQKYFPLLDPQGKLTHQFLVVSNIQPADPSAVIEGNERVVRPRLADAKFFFDQDRKKSLESRVAGLSKVVYHNQLGSQGDRMERVRAITHIIVQHMHNATQPYTAQTKQDLDMLAHKADQAAHLAKADLLTDMVGEFPELQGTMGAYYARHDGLRDGVAIAIEDHYKPRFAGDDLPRNHTGTVVALADKLETLIGMFGIGNLPSGDKDPFALRRHAVGVIRLLTERLPLLALTPLLRDAQAVFGSLIQDPTDALGRFIDDRLASSLSDEFSTSAIDSVLALRPDLLAQVRQRLLAVRRFSELPEALPLAAANKRVGNILKKSADTQLPELNSALLQEPAEQALAQALATVAPSAQAAYDQGDYTASLQALAVLKAPVDQFFADVMVNSEDEALRLNRLALLQQLHGAMNRVADLSRIGA